MYHLHALELFEVVVHEGALERVVVDVEEAKEVEQQLRQEVLPARLLVVPRSQARLKKMMMMPVMVRERTKPRSGMKERRRNTQ